MARSTTTSSTATGSPDPSATCTSSPRSTRSAFPAEFLEPNTVYELEVLALEASGNQTVIVGFFLTA